MRFLNQLNKIVKKQNWEVIEEKVITDCLINKGYIKQDGKWEKRLDSNEVDYFTTLDITRELNKLGFKKDRKFKVYYKGETGKKSIGDRYLDEILQEGTKRYCCDEDDDYIDDPRDTLEDYELPCKMLEEIKEFSEERGLSNNLGLQYIILDYFKKERTQDTFLKNLLNRLNEEDRSFEEIEYIKKFYKKNQKNKKELKEKPYSEILSAFYIEKFNLLFKAEEVEEIKNICFIESLNQYDFELIEAFYYSILDNEKMTFKELIQLYENDFELEDKEIIEELKKLGISENELTEIVSIENKQKGFLKDCLGYADYYKLKDFSQLKVVYENGFEVPESILREHLLDNGMSKAEYEEISNLFDKSTRKREENKKQFITTIYLDVLKYDFTDFEELKEYLTHDYSKDFKINHECFNDFIVGD